MEKEKREQESCTSCAYRKDWYCPVAGDRVKREGGTVLNTRKVRLRRKSSSAIMARKGRENQPFFKRSKMCNKLY